MELWLLFVILLILSAFFSGVEIALFSFSDIKIRHLVRKKTPGAKTVQKLKSNPHKLLITILLCNNVVNVGAAVVATILATEIFGSKGAGIATGATTFFLLVFGEITPKAIAAQNAEIISLWIAKPLEILQFVLLPITIIFDWITRSVTHFFKKEKKPLVSEEELKTMVVIGEEEGVIGEMEKEMIHNVFRFDDITIKKVMIPKKKILYVKADEQIKTVAKKILRSGFTRIPIFDNDYVVGMALAKDVLRYFLNNKQNIKVVKIAKPTIIIKETKKIDALFRKFQRKRQHIAIVVDKNKKIVGLVTLEDLLEEIVGEIYDESDKKKRKS